MDSKQITLLALLSVALYYIFKFVKPEIDNNEIGDFKLNIPTSIPYTNNFTLKEFHQKDGNAKVPIKYYGNLQKLMNNLQVLRDYYNKPININSGYRSQDYNSKIKVRQQIVCI